MSNKGLITDKFQTAELDLQKLNKGHEKSSCFDVSKCLIKNVEQLYSKRPKKGKAKRS